MGEVWDCNELALGNFLCYLLMGCGLFRSRLIADGDDEDEDEDLMEKAWKFKPGFKWGFDAFMSLKLHANVFDDTAK